MTAKRSRHWRGPKLKPIVVRPAQMMAPVALSDEKRREFISQEFTRSTLEGLAAGLQQLEPLLVHYGIDPSSPSRWFVLAYQLATDYVPNFAPLPALPKTGPNRKVADRFALVAAIDLVAIENAKGIRDAARRLKANNDPCCHTLGSAASIEATYHKDRKALASITACAQLLALWDLTPRGTREVALLFFNDLFSTLEIVELGDRDLRQCLVIPEQVEVLRHLIVLLSLPER